jgi:hypothetical protein
MLGLALCFAVDFWPWILLPVALTMILGALFNPITMGLAGVSFLSATQTQQQPYQQQPYSPQNRPDYQQGYQGSAGEGESQPTYQQGERPLYSQPKQEFEQPQMPSRGQPQELPPMEQKE